MSEELPEAKPDPTPAQLAAARPKAELTSSEKEAYEGKLKEKDEEIADLKKENAELKKPKTEKKKDSVLKRFSPL